MKKVFKKTGKIIFVILKCSTKFALYCFLFSGALCLGIIKGASEQNFKKTRRKSFYRMPRGYGWIKEPKKYMYNKQYNFKRKLFKF